jgi:hypothetical protein
MRKTIIKNIIIVFVIIIGYNSNCLSQNTEELNKQPGSDSISNINKDRFNRTLLHFQAPIYTSKVTGKVVIIVWVNKDGAVINAKADSVKSNTLNKELIGNAIVAAYKAKFSSIDKDTIQKSSLTYNYLRK